MFHPALETILRVLHVPEVLVLAPELEPRGVIARLCCALKVAERVARVVWDELGVDAGRGARCAHVDRLGDMGSERALLRLGGDLQDDGERDVDELLELGVIDLRRADCGIARIGVCAGEKLLGAIDEREHVFAPDDLARGIARRLLDRHLLYRENGHRGQRRGERRGAIARARGGGR